MHSEIKNGPQDMEKECSGTNNWLSDMNNGLLIPVDFML